MPKKSNSTSATKYTKQKNLITNLSKKQPLNTLRFDENYFEVMRNRWLIDKYIVKNGIFTNEAEENTLTAFSRAVKEKKPTTITVRALKDGVIVCYKDRTLARANSNGYIQNCEYAEVKDLVLNGTDDERIPTLEQVLDVIGGKVPVVIDILNSMTTHKPEEQILAIIDKYMTSNNLNEGVAVMSINPFSLEWFASNAPWLPRILRSGKFKIKKYGELKTRHMRKLKYHTIANADYIAYNAKDLPYRGINKVKPVGVIAYNVRNQAEYTKLAKHIDNIIYEGFEPEI